MIADSVLGFEILEGNSGAFCELNLFAVCDWVAVGDVKTKKHWVRSM